MGQESNPSPSAAPRGMRRHAGKALSWAMARQLGEGWVLCLLSRRDHVSMDTVCGYELIPVFLPHVRVGRDLVGVPHLHPVRQRPHDSRPPSLDSLHPRSFVSFTLEVLSFPLPFVPETWDRTVLQRTRVSRVFGCFSATFRRTSHELISGLFFEMTSDAYLIAFWVVLFWFLREASMRWLWEPLARKLNLKEGKTKVRFAEQGWNLLYYSVFWSLGLVSIVFLPSL